MRFLTFNSFHNLEVVNCSLVLIFHYCLFAVIARKVVCRMTLRSPVETCQRNTIANSHFTYALEDALVSYQHKKILQLTWNQGIRYGIEGNDDSSMLTSSFNRRTNIRPVFPLSYADEEYSCMFGSLKSGALIANPYQFENLFTKRFLKSLFTATKKTKKDISEEETFLGKRNTLKQIYSKQESSSSDLIISAPLNGFSEVECNGSKRGLTWKQLALQIPNELKHLYGGLSELLAAQGSAMTESIPKKTTGTYNGFPRRNRKSVITKTAKVVIERKISKVETKISKTTLSINKDDSKCSTAKPVVYPFECAIPKTVLPIHGDEFKKFKTSPLKWVLEPLIAENESKMLKNENLAFEALLRMIFFITKDDSNSDLKHLEDGVNWFYPSSVGNSLGSAKIFYCFPLIRKYDGLDSSDIHLPKPLQEKWSCNDNQCTKKNKESKISKELCPTTKRSRVDSGICLAPNFEEISPESDSCENLSFLAFKMDVSHEFISGLSSTCPSYFEDCMKLCDLCRKLILDKSFLACRFGLLLNCWHSFCYLCIRNHSKSHRLSTTSVKCPKCGQHSPGIVPSSRWIDDPDEKTALFQEYEKESKDFYNQQQVFFENKLSYFK